MITANRDDTEAELGAVSAAVESTSNKVADIERQISRTGAQPA